MKRLVFLLFTLISVLFSQENNSIVFALQFPIVVTASRTPSSLMRAARTVSVLDSGALAQLPVHSVQEALAYIGGVDLQQRGSQGVQADVNLRGAGYEQTLILIDGVKVNDPQTGHHNLNLAISLQDVERIEVLKGGASGLYGPGAMGGVINVVTKKPAKKRLDFSLFGGDFRYNELNMNYNFQALKAMHKLSLSRSNSAGYRPNTNFTISTLTYQNRIAMAQNDFLVTAAYQAKDFGASRFYHPAYPNQQEKTRTFFLSAAGQFNWPAGCSTLSPKIYWRRHTDDFWLDYKQPDWYHNNHVTDVLGAELLGRFTSRLGHTALQAEMQWNAIRSNNLNNHQRNMAGFSAEHQFTLRRWLIVFGSSFYYFNRWGWQINPSLDISFQFNPRFTFYISAATGFRPPTFTELYYSSPANRGNPQLKPERSRDAEIGARFRTQRTSTTLSLFRRSGSNWIDWLFEEDGAYWQAENVLEVTTSGLEISSQMSTGSRWLKQIRFDFCYLNSDKARQARVSKYVFNYLRQQFIVSLDQYILKPMFTLSWKVRYENRVNFSDYLLADVQFSWQFNKLKCIGQITNLLDQTYQDFVSIPQPGRWFKLGLQFKVF